MMTRQEQILKVLRNHGTSKAEEIFFTTAKIEVKTEGKRKKDAMEYLGNYGFGNTDSKWRTSGHYHLRKLCEEDKIVRCFPGYYRLLG